MTLSISQKLIAAFVGLTLLVLIATLGLARWSFEKGFLDYMNALEQLRLEQVESDMAREYIAAGRSWGFMTEQRFAAMVLDSSPRKTLPGAPPRGRPPGFGDKGDRRPPGPDRRRPPMRFPAAPPTALYDAGGSLVAGATLPTDAALVIRVPIVVDGQTVGDLRSEPRRSITSPLETEFSRQQLTTSWVLGLVSLLLAFMVSVLLSRGMLAPIKRMISSVARLSSGDYGHRMSERRRDELGELTRDIDRLGSTLQANQSSRKRLLADVSHELRTPLTVLTGEIEALKDGLREFDSAQLESLDQEVRRLRYLVDDLYELSVSDVGGLKYQFTAVNLNASLVQVVNGMRSRATTAGITLTLTEPGVDAANSQFEVRGDSRRLDQLLQNLLENSLAYTDAPGSVNVGLSRESACIIITIEDTSPGVASVDCEKLFDPLFRQESSRSRRTGGAGLGLAICRNIVAAHHGQIWASPSALGGLAVHIELPVASEDKA